MTKCFDLSSQLTASDIARSALLLDVDGTLIDLAAHPDLVKVPPSLRASLERAFTLTKGAVALVSGRSIKDLDALFAPLVLPAAGVHGAEIRDASGRLFLADDVVMGLDGARRMLLEHVNEWPGCFVEDKRYALAVHYRNAPEFAESIAAVVFSLAAELGADFTALPGKFVFEVKSARFTKSTAIATLLEHGSFQGRRPIFLGDDITDESGFAVVNARGGVSVRIGSSTDTAAQHIVPDAQRVRDWLEQLTSAEAAIS